MTVYRDRAHVMRAHRADRQREMRQASRRRTTFDSTTLYRAFRYCAEHIEQDRGTNGDARTDAELALLEWVREKIDEHAAA